MSGISDEMVEAAARAWAEATGEVVTYHPDSVDDHNRWSWQGIGDDTGHSEEWKDVNFRRPARAALAAVEPLIAEREKQAQAEVADAFQQWGMTNEIGPMDWPWFGEICRRYASVYEGREDKS